MIRLGIFQHPESRGQDYVFIVPSDRCVTAGNFYLAKTSKGNKPVIAVSNSFDYDDSDPNGFKAILKLFGTTPENLKPIIGNFVFVGWLSEKDLAIKI